MSYTATKMHYPITTEENTESLKYTEGNTLIQAVKREDQYHWCGKYEDVASSQFKAYSQFWICLRAWFVSN